MTKDQLKAASESVCLIYREPCGCVTEICTTYPKVMYGFLRDHLRNLSGVSVVPMEFGRNLFAKFDQCPNKIQHWKSDEPTGETT